MIFSYARVSTSEQAVDGTTSLAEQERKNRAIATLRGATSFDFVTYRDVGVSGSVPLSQRPSGKDMLAAAGKGDVIVANKLDRLFRSATDALTTAKTLAGRGIDLVLIDMGVEPVTQSGAAKLFFGMLALVAEFERERIAERMASGKEAKRASRGHIGGDAPFGFRKTGIGRDARLEPDVEEQDVIHLVADLRKRQKPDSIARILNELGVRSRAGGALQRLQVIRMLKNQELMNG